MTEIKDKTFDEERALYGSKDIKLVTCSFDGIRDGESALKESSNISVEGCYCNLRYPFWHDDDIKITDTKMTEKCRAALWYSKGIRISGGYMHGIKALRECSDISIEDCDILSPEFGWSSKNICIKRTSCEGEYFMLRAGNLNFSDVKLKGKYSFQYVTDALINKCEFDTKDAFWHARNMVIRDSVIRGEYLAWYSEDLTFENCVISGTQPFCYARNLILKNCEMHDTDLCFEKSTVDAHILTHVISIKNPTSGDIYVPSVGEIIMDDENAKGHIHLS